MLDLAYVAATVVFFLLLILYVRGCERLGADDEGGGDIR
jgi:hypothetical protein